jgi:TPR repeat protein
VLADDTQAIVLIAVCYLIGFGVAQSSSEGIRYFKRAADLGNGVGMAEYGFWTAQQNSTEALMYIRRSVEMGLPNGYSRYATALRDGLGVPQDTKEAAKYFLLESQAQNARPSLDYILALSQGDSMDQIEAARISRQLADKGNGAMAFQLANLLEDGVENPINWTDVVRYFKQAADANLSVGKFRYAGYVVDGLYVQQNWTEALRLFKASAEQGLAEGWVPYGLMIEYGPDEEKNLTEAAFAYKAAAKAGLGRGMLEYARCLDSGIGVSQNDQKALKYYQKLWMDVPEAAIRLNRMISERRAQLPFTQFVQIGMKARNLMLIEPNSSESYWW